MVQVSLQRGKPSAAALWHDILRYTVRLGHGGMSDEDDGEQSVQRGSRTNTERVRIIQLLPFRHPFFALLFEAVDRTPILDPDAFKQTGKTPLTRVRDGKVLCTRKPPKDLPLLAGTWRVCSLTSAMNSKYIMEMNGHSLSGTSIVHVIRQRQCNGH